MLPESERLCTIYSHLPSPGTRVHMYVRTNDYMCRWSRTRSGAGNWRLRPKSEVGPWSGTYRGKLKRRGKPSSR